MNLLKSPWRWLLTLVVCLLVVCVAALAVRAKTSQYPRQPGFSPHFSKANKMCNDRTQKSVAVHQVDVTLWREPELPVFPEYIPPEQVPAKQRDAFLSSFPFRPPPPSV